MRIALTGGIGSGKSAVMDIIRSHGYNCVSSDAINDALLQNPDYIEQIARVFPTALVDKKIDKRVLAKIVFNNNKERKKLNNIAHPIIRNLALEMSDYHGLNFVEVPLLFECGFEVDYDKVVVVTADIETRIERVKARDNRPVTEIKSIINSQIKSYANKKIDYTIENNSSLEDLTEKVEIMLFNLEKANFNFR